MAYQVNKKIFTGIGLDFETGDLECIEGAITQLSMQAIRLDTMEIIGSYNNFILPYNKKDIGGPIKRKVLKNKHEIDDTGIRMIYKKEALEYSGITMDTLIKKGVDIQTLAKDVIEFCKRHTLSNGKNCKPVLIGQNITFDIGFLQQLMNYTGLVTEFKKVFAGKVDFYGNFQPQYIDTIDLAKLALAHDTSVISYNLENIAEKLGFELDDAHDADADVTATLNIARVLSNRMRNHSEYNVGDIIQKKKKSRNYFKI